jgi:hypothetical protein
MGSTPSSNAEHHPSPAQAAVDEWKKTERTREAVVRQQLMTAIDTGKVCGHRKLCLQVYGDITARDMQRNLKTLLYSKGWPSVHSVDYKYATTGPDPEGEETVSHITVEFDEFAPTSNKT